MMRPIFRSMLLMLAWFVSALAPSRAAAVTVSVTPPDTTVLVGSTFALRIETGAFADLKAFQLIFMFDPTKIQFLGATAGDVLTNSGNPYSLFVLPDYVAPPDTAWTDCAMLVGSSSGPGILNFYDFKALAVGDSPVQCKLVDFRDSNNTQTLPACNSGIVRVIAPTPVRLTSWGRVKQLYR
jgi:hypothetical protein